MTTTQELEITNAEKDNGEIQVLLVGFDDFYRREYRLVVGFAYALTGRWSASEDLAQEAFTAAFKSWSTVQRLDKPGAWVRRVVANRSVSLFRRAAAEARGLMRMASRTSGTSYPELSIETEYMWEWVRGLPRRQAQIVAMRYLGELSVAEIAAVLDLSRHTINTHLRRAMTTLGERAEEMELR